ncbi:hypothetical protein IQ782_05575 [Salipiger pacificus]|uniref:Uncharacterized protein n=2 Tax=Salipiger mangrovisoli TaxID=2865933 RepID=A0ABR9WYG2_9RHOB|nr:hypothetical protein [Salipiger mangrovisoli]
MALLVSAQKFLSLFWEAEKNTTAEMGFGTRFGRMMDDYKSSRHGLSDFKVHFAVFLIDRSELPEQNLIWEFFVKSWPNSHVIPIVAYIDLSIVEKLKRQRKRCNIKNVSSSGFLRKYFPDSYGFKKSLSRAASIVSGSGVPDHHELFSGQPYDLRFDSSDTEVSVFVSPVRAILESDPRSILESIPSMNAHVI